MEPVTQRLLYLEIRVEKSPSRPAKGVRPHTHLHMLVCTYMCVPAPVGVQGLCSSTHSICLLQPAPEWCP
jgi:hypothetical protein